jgi:hypothetical protein
MSYQVSRLLLPVLRILLWLMLLLMLNVLSMLKVLSRVVVLLLQMWGSHDHPAVSVQRPGAVL